MGTAEGAWGQGKVTGCCPMKHSAGAKWGGRMEVARSAGIEGCHWKAIRGSYAEGLPVPWTFVKRCCTEAQNWGTARGASRTGHAGLVLTTQHHRGEVLLTSIRQLLGAADAQTAHLATYIQHSPSTPTTGLCERGNDTSRSTGRSGRQEAATRRNIWREEWVTVQGPVNKQQPDGMSHREGGTYTTYTQAQR